MFFLLKEEYLRNCENEEHKTVPIPALELVKAEDFYGTNTGKYFMGVFIVLFYLKLRISLFVGFIQYTRLLK